MSADLFEAFVGKQPSRKESVREQESKSSSGLLIQTDSPRPEDTWQSWPTADVTASKALSHHQSQTLWATGEDGQDVLFDAENFDTEPIGSTNDDDFGDFEQATTVAGRSGSYVSQVTSQSIPANLLGLHVDETTLNEAIGATSPPEVVKTPSQGIAVAGKFSQIASGEEVTTSADEQDDEWGDFATTEMPSVVNHLSSQRRVPQKATAPPTREQTSLARSKPKHKTAASPLKLNSNPVENENVEEEPWDSFGDEEPDKSHAFNNIAEVSQRDRPTNVPPPAVLLAWVPKIFSALAAQARQLNAHSDTGISALQAYRVSARIIAGRAARWKRDNVLAQSMRIGVAGRSGGMKLTALDKGESRKEDQAAEEVIASWTCFSHVLNTAIIRANAQKPPMALSSKLSARTAVGLDVVTATHICAVCGLRRNERVLGIDMNVSDTFGEFWVEHWGHKDCADTWYGFNKLLNQR